MDVDHFKLNNDRHGHGVGDAVLQALAQRIMAIVPEDAVVSRLGGDEFCVFVMGDLDRGRVVANALVTAARRPIDTNGGGSVDVTVSVGLAALPTTAGLEDALRSADTALYVAKIQGRHRLMEVNQETQQVVAARRELAHAVAHLQERNRALQQQVQTDALTGLLGRRALDDVLGVTCGGTSGARRSSAVAFLDIDHFGDYNKRHGDGMGDETLRAVAQTIQRTARRNDLVFRKGGEEIVVVQPDATEDEARVAAERMRSAVQSLSIQSIRHRPPPKWSR